jgi:hypothetical protein
MVCSDEYGLSAALMAIENNELMRDLLNLDGIQEMRGVPAEAAKLWAAGGGEDTVVLWLR